MFLQTRRFFATTAFFCLFFTACGTLGGQTAEPRESPEPTSKPRSQPAAEPEEPLGDSPPVPATDPDGKSRVAVKIPYPEKTSINFAWRRDGFEVATTRFRWQNRAEEGEAPEIDVDSELDYHADGRRLVVSGSTKLWSDLRPRYFFGRFAQVADPGYRSGYHVAASFGKDAVEVALVQAGKPQVDREMRCQAPYYLYEAQSFEHLALFAPVLLQGGAGTYRFVMPSENKILELVFTRLTGAAAKTSLGADEVAAGSSAWQLEHPSMKARLHLDAAGRLTYFKQGKTEIVRAE